ncbi:MAG: hypothetical protein LBJ01_01530 [Tannerella sp.]|nr:hypothetical protein [Tannerella sp.]
MENLVEMLSVTANAVLNSAELLLFRLCESGLRPETASGLLFAFAAGGMIAGELTGGTLAAVARWHGGIDARYTNIKNLVGILKEKQTDWSVPQPMYAGLVANSDRLGELIPLCKSTAASTDDRNLRNSILKATVAACLQQVKMWVFGKYYEGVVTKDDIHRLGFLLPGETGGHKSRSGPVDVVPEVKIRVLSPDAVKIIVDQAAAENAAQVAHGWPPGVEYVLIVITSVNENKEIIRQVTTTLHTSFDMPEGCHGQQYAAKASFLKHVSDSPRFSNEVTFSMPLTTGDLIAELDRQHHEDYENQIREVERQRQEIERLQAELKTKL